MVDVLEGRACGLGESFWQHWNNGVVAGRGPEAARENRLLRAAVRSVLFIEVRCMVSAAGM